MESVYSRYSGVQSDDADIVTHGVFAIIYGPCGDREGVLIKQRNGNAGSPYLFELPGGRFDPVQDESFEGSLDRRVREELGLFAVSKSAIGSSLDIRFEKDGLVQVDRAHLFLASSQGMPETTTDAISFAYVTPESLAGFNIVSGGGQELRRMGIMIFRGLSLKAKPLYQGLWRDEFASFIDQDLRELHDKDWRDYFSLEGERYLGQRNEEHVTIFPSLNPFCESGRHVGTLENLF